MNYSYTAKKRIRKNFGKLGDVLPIPNLIELQLLSYNKFLGKNTGAVPELEMMPRDRLDCRLEDDGNGLLSGLVIFQPKKNGTDSDKLVIKGVQLAFNKVAVHQQNTGGFVAQLVCLNDRQRPEEYCADIQSGNVGI